MKTAQGNGTGSANISLKATFRGINRDEALLTNQTKSLRVPPLTTSVTAHHYTYCFDITTKKVFASLFPFTFGGNLLKILNLSN